MAVQFHLCPHERDGIDDETTVSNYFALNSDEIMELLQMVLDDNTPETAAKVAGRLMQGIKGITCPTPDGGPISECINEVGELVNKLRFGRRRLNQQLIDEFERILDY